MTSGASETILRNFFSRSSRATGPNTRVPTGSLASLMTTAAFWSKRMDVPSRRRYSLRVRTITALTTLPFLTVPSGEASLTAAVTTSPRPAFLPRPPPRGRITCNLRAPELSATSSIVLICTDIVLLLVICGAIYGGDTAGGHAPGLTLLGFNGCRGPPVVRKRERGAANNLLEGPTLELRQRTGFANADDVADAGGVLLVMRVELLVRLHDALVFGVSLAHLDLDDDGLLHFGRYNEADLLNAA